MMPPTTTTGRTPVARQDKRPDLGMKMMTSTADIHGAAALLQAGLLDEAIDAQLLRVRAHPADTTARHFLAELLVAAGELPRADRQLDMIADQAPEQAVGLAGFRQLIRAEQIRREVMTEGRVPDFLDTPPPAVAKALEALVAIRAGRHADAAAAVIEAETLRPRGAIEVNGGRVDDFRDACDLTGPVLELLTASGRYFWVPLERVRRMVFQAPRRLIDLIWRPVEIETEGGPDGMVFMPAIYALTADSQDAALKLGRRTDWATGEGPGVPQAGPISGRGQRCFLAGDELMPALELTEIRRLCPAAGSGEGAA